MICIGLFNFYFGFFWFWGGKEKREKGRERERESDVNPFKRTFILFYFILEILKIFFKYLNKNSKKKKRKEN